MQTFCVLWNKKRNSTVINNIDNPQIELNQLFSQENYGIINMLIFYFHNLQLN